MSQIVAVEKCFYWMIEEKTRSQLFKTVLCGLNCIPYFYFYSTKEVSIYPFQDTEGVRDPAE